ncbi:cobalamin biosynthesis protein CobD [Agathobacter rectalis]|jgi:adenosylcobinamide-phosphate synthase|uniref:Cobalamin biosynthesis protein CobD n=1 Tax=Agathobacter rectalis TaxID=39491 RepID=A0A3E4LYM2_9FIRM|nr:adenosylcobinamide-phosphate synthase CbiB [Agathobacter rectalis]HAX67816.1 cobalamin biosynthesis protein CobD [Eubacterium sp.]RGK42568.1 cobalamin biosynthesis protein CobD [Agathobacter rectalis]RGM50579.1 cobalamin biosynthesis protein CobD [Agathobacter rectalis]RGM70638.1 cobalamin biosynthesis protein CobD [Agathobacter rectalis]RGU27024.1 cobalamin biosynthesis protein CobD [Agathobacter rectalis]
MCYHIFAFIAGFVLDLLIGDPHFIPHPVRLIGSLISFCDKRLNCDAGYNISEKKLNLIKYKRGMLLAFTVIFATFAISVIIIVAAYSINLYAGVIAEAVMTWQILATKCLRVESMRVYDALRTDGVDAGRRAVSMIVGRDTSVLDAAGVTRAAVETIAENTSDGVIAPMLYTAIGGPVLGFVYKAVNTMDSMLGYKNDKYMYFGRFAARLDDVVNFIPARISAYLMIAAAFIGGRQFDGKNAYRIFKRDRFNHASPNSAQTESVCAGALRVQLAGDAVYFGKLVKKKYIGDGLREIEYEDIKRANRLMYITAFLCELISVAVMSLVLILL